MRDSRDARTLVARMLLDGESVPNIRRRVAAEYSAREADPELARIIGSVKTNLTEALRPGRYATKRRAAPRIG